MNAKKQKKNWVFFWNFIFRITKKKCIDLELFEFQEQITIDSFLMQLTKLQKTVVFG